MEPLSKNIMPLGKVVDSPFGIWNKPPFGDAPPVGTHQEIHSYGGGTQRRALTEPLTRVSGPLKIDRRDGDDQQKLSRVFRGVLAPMGWLGWIQTLFLTCAIRVTCPRFLSFFLSLLHVRSFCWQPRDYSPCACSHHWSPPPIQSALQPAAGKGRDRTWAPPPGRQLHLILNHDAFYNGVFPWK